MSKISKTSADLLELPIGDLDEVHTITSTNHPHNTDLTPDETLPPPPNGGFDAWRQVIAAFFAAFNSWGIVNAFGVYQQYYQNDLLRHESPFQISWIVSLAGFLTYFGTNFFGGLIDLGYLKVLGLCGSLLQFAALLLLSWSKTYAEVILTQGVMVGMVGSVLFLISISAVAPYFTTKRPIAVGIGAAGASVGGTVYSSVARRVIVQLGFGWSTRMIAFISLATTAITFVCLKRRLPPSRRRAFVALECATELPFMLFCVGNAFYTWGTYVFYVYFETFAAETLPREHFVEYMTAIVNTGSALGRTVPALFAQRFGPVNVQIVAELISMVLSFCWIAVKNAGGLVSLCILFGFFTGPTSGLVGAIVSNLTSDFHRLGIRLSFALTFMGFGVIIGPPIAGIILRKYGWFWLQIFSSLAFVGAVSCHLGVRFAIAGTKSDNGGLNRCVASPKRTRNSLYTK